MTQPDSRNVAFIGLGNMGTPMSRRLIEAGYRVSGFDLSEAARDQLTLSLTFDHRAVDGAPAARFLQALVGLIENPGPWLIT